jgi:hypothetical protein
VFSDGSPGEVTFELSPAQPGEEPLLAGHVIRGYEVLRPARLRLRGG